MAVASATGRSAPWAVGLLLLCAAVFAPMLGHEWLLYDDDLYVTANPDLRLGLSPDGIGWAFTTFHGANWFPLTWLSWMFDYELYGMQAGGFLATNLALHAAATLILFLALLRMSGRPGRSAFVAAVFAVHPLHVEPVAWVSGRKDPLSGVFFACVLYVWAGCESPGPSPRRVALATLLLGLGLLAKQTLLTLPFVLVLLDAWPLRRLGGDDGGPGPRPSALARSFVEKWPLFAMVAVMSVVTFLAQRSAGAVAGLSDLAFPARVANAVVAVATYVQKAFLPTGLAVFYPHPRDTLGAGEVGLALAALAAISALALWAWRREPAVLVGWLWFLGTLVPVLGLVQVGSQARADRYTYLPLVGLAIAVAWGVPGAVSGALRSAQQRGRVLLAAGAVAVALLAVTASLQLRTWRDTETLMRHALAVTSRNHIAHAYLGVALLRRGAVGEGLEHWRESARIAPTFLTVHNNLAWFLATSSDRRFRSPEEAVVLAEQSRRLAGDDPAVLDTLAAAYAAAGRFPAATDTAARAVALAEAQGNAALAAALSERLALYRRGMAYVER